MNDTTKSNVERLVQVKNKLLKYADLENELKVKEYINYLETFKVDLDLLKKSDIVSCLKTLKHKQNASYSNKAGDLVKKWKAKFTSEPSSSTSKQLSVSMNNDKLNSSQTSLNTSQSSMRKRSIAEHNKTAPCPTLDLDDSAKRQKLSFLDYKKKVEDDIGKGGKPLSTTTTTTKTNNKSDIYKINENNFKSHTMYNSHNDHSPNNNSNNNNDNDNDNDSERIKVNISSAGSNKTNRITNSSSIESSSCSNSSTSSNHSINGGCLPSKSLSSLIKAPPLPSIPLPKSLPTEMSYGNLNMTNSNGLRSSSTKPVNQTADDDILQKIFSSKGRKTMLYTGKKTNLGADGTFKVPKLYDLSIKALVNNIEDLPNRLYYYNVRSQFPTPYDLIKPVLEKANARQLENIESLSPNLLSDTDTLWKKLCEQEFKKCERQDEDETWRELYFRKKDDRDQEYQRVRDFISSKNAGKPKERQTQLATYGRPKVTSSSAAAAYSSSLGSSKTQTMQLLNHKSSSSVRVISSGTERNVMKRLGGSSNTGSGGNSNSSQTSVKKSQGMKDTLKLIKKMQKR